MARETAVKTCHAVDDRQALTIWVALGQIPS